MREATLKQKLKIRKLRYLVEIGCPFGKKRAKLRNQTSSIKPFTNSACSKKETVLSIIYDALRHLCNSMCAIRKMIVFTIFKLF
jgi:hypothetical protein